MNKLHGINLVHINASCYALLKMNTYIDHDFHICSKLALVVDVSELVTMFVTKRNILPPPQQNNNGQNGFQSLRTRKSDYGLGNPW
jgi:hypothetical protein